MTATQSRRPTVLVVDDDRNLRTIIATNLELAGFDVEGTADGASALKMLDHQVPDVVLLDVTMPVMDGYQTLGRIRRHATASHVPVIILTGTTNVDAVKSLEAGADDFIAKPFSPQEMLARVRAKVRRASVDASRQPLTRLPGNIAIEHEIRRRFDAHAPWAVIYADLDNFKAYNDVYGFARGDEAIKFVAATLAESIREQGDGSGDFLGHIGGDDFIVVTVPDRAEGLARQSAARFDTGVGALYDPADRSRGYIDAKDRRGRPTRYPLMSLSLAVVTPNSQISSYQQIGEVAAELKRFAKGHDGSYVAVDKRR